MKTRYIRRNRLTPRQLDTIPMEEKLRLAKLLYREQYKKKAQQKAEVAELRRIGALRGIGEELRQKPAVLRDRAQKAFKRALEFNPGAEYVDYELIMLDRPELCPECGEAMPDEKLLTIAHVVSLERFGEHKPENIEVLHTLCHKRSVAKSRRNRKILAKTHRLTLPEDSKLRWAKWSKEQEEKKKAQAPTKEEKEQEKEEARRAALFAKWDALKQEGEKKDPL